MICKHSPLFTAAHLQWTHYRVELMVEKLTGGLPSHEELIGAWMASRGAGPVTPTQVADLTSEPVDRVAAQADRVAELVGEEIEKTHTVVFARDDGRPAYEGRAFNGALKESANILKEQFGVRNFRSKLVERVFVCERYSTFPAETVIRIEERPISVMTRQGPRTSLKRCEVVESVPIAFTLHVLEDGVVKPTFLETMIRYSCLNGFGADRSQGSGRAEIVDFVRL